MNNLALRPNLLPALQFTRTLSLDIETRSDVDLTKRGVYNYVSTANFCLLWVTYAFNYGQTKTVDLWAGPMPDELVEALLDPTCLKIAANATFERICFSRVLGKHLTAHDWTCTLVLSGRNGFPMHLDGAGAQTRVHVQKDKAGKDLIKLFSIPQKPKKNSLVLQQDWVNPEQQPEMWQMYGRYNNTDVLAEMAIRTKLREALPVSEFEEDLYVLDQKINDRGVMIDREFVKSAIAINLEVASRLKEEIIKLTGVKNPNSRNQLIEWLETETQETHTKLDKEAVIKILGYTDSEVVQKVLTARQTLNLASVGKYKAMMNYAGLDDRCRGILQFYGANRTGRWAGRGIQVQNMTKHRVKAEVLERWRHLIRIRDLHALSYEEGHTVNSILSQAVRSSFIARPGHQFIVSDYSAIEARVLAWLAGEQWRLDLFAGHDDIYLASVARVMGIDVKTLSKKDPLRQLGKVMELAFGYGGSTGALQMALGTYNLDLPTNKHPEIIRLWRNANPNIVKFWEDINGAAMNAILHPGQYITFGNQKLGFIFKGENLLMRLPSGRFLSYVRARISQNRWGHPGIVYEGSGDQGAWSRLDTYGGKLAENACQAVARDILAHGMMNLDKNNFDIVMHVHDESVIEEIIGGRTLEEVNYWMCVPQPWYADMPLRAEGFVSPYYKKDDN